VFDGWATAAQRSNRLRAADCPGPEIRICGGHIPTSLRSVSGAIRHDTPEEVGKFSLPNRFRYWDLKEAATDVPVYGFSKIGTAPMQGGEAQGVGGNGFRIRLWVNDDEAGRIRSGEGAQRLSAPKYGNRPRCCSLKIMLS
jgi:hypothetical protein